MILGATVKQSADRNEHSLARLHINKRNEIVFIAHSQGASIRRPGEIDILSFRFDGGL